MRTARLSFVALLLSIAAAAGPAIAQDGESPAELRREIDTFRERIAELEARLSRSQERIDQLLEENKSLRDALREGGASGGAGAEEPGAEAETVEIPRDPFASPASMKAAIQRSWDDQFKGVDVDDPDERRQYLREIRRWASQIQREMRGRFEWRALVLDPRDQGRSVVATIQTIDDQGRPIGGTFEIEAVGRAQRTVLAARSDDPLILEGAIDLNIDVDARLGAGPDQIGPYLKSEIDATVTDARYP